MPDARQQILDRIRHANHRTTTLTDANAAWNLIDRSYNQSPRLTTPGILNLFENRLREYDANVFSATNNNITGIVQQTLEARHISRCLIPSGLSFSWLPASLEFTIGDDLTTPELDTFTSVVTTATLGIAETGTIVLQSLPGQGPRALTLIPDYHLCIVRASTIVETVVEATRLLDASKTIPTTWFSGPSATADIEMTRIKGVHGPRFLDVIILHE